MQFDPPTLERVANLAIYETNNEVFSTLDRSKNKQSTSSKNTSSAYPSHPMSTSSKITTQWLFWPPPPR